MMDIFYYDGKVKKSSINELEKIKNKPVWIDITGISKDEAELLAKIFNLHPLTTEDLQTSTSRIKIEEFNDYLFCVFYSIKKSKKSFNMLELDFLLGESFIITNHKYELKSHTSLKEDKVKLELLLKKGTEYVFHKLLDEEIDNYFPILELLDDQIEEIEEKVIKTPRAEQLTEILKLKRYIVIIKRHVFQQREKISFLAKNDYSFIEKKARIYFRDVYDHAIRVSDSVDNYREAIGETFDAYMSAVNNNMNEVMKVLSIFATIALPMTVISGIYGTNFLNLPGSKAYYGFWIMIIALLLFSISMIIMFKKRKWI